MTDEQSYHRQHHAEHADSEEFRQGEPRQDEGSGETPERPEKEIDARRNTGLFQREAEALHDNLGSAGVHADVDAHVGDDAQEKQQYRSVPEELEAVDEA